MISVQKQSIRLSLSVFFTGFTSTDLSEKFQNVTRAIPPYRNHSYLRRHDRILTSWSAENFYFWCDKIETHPRAIPETQKKGQPRMANPLNFLVGARGFEPPTSWSQSSIRYVRQSLTPQRAIFVCRDIRGSALVLWVERKRNLYLELFRDNDCVSQEVCTNAK